jgi:hypothetical protein
MVKIRNNDLMVDTEKAFESISISVSAIQRLARNQKKRRLLESFGIEPDNFTPVVATEITIDQWIKVLQFYAKKCEYQPARDILTDLKKIIFAR